MGSKLTADVMSCSQGQPFSVALHRQLLAQRCVCPEHYLDLNDTHKTIYLALWQSILHVK